MFNGIINQFIAGITVISITIGSWFGLVPNAEIVKLQNQINSLEDQLSQAQQLGAFYQVGGDYYQLWGSGVTASATSIILQSLQMPVSNQELVMEDFGEIGYGTIEPGSATKREFFSFTGITQSGSSDQATLTGVSRGLSPTSPYTASTTLQLTHSGGAKVIFSNSPAFYSQFVTIKNNETITGIKTFASTSIPLQDYYTAPTDDKQFTPKKYVDDSTNAGAANISTTTAGIAQIWNTDQMINFTTTTGTSGRLLVPYLYYFATSSDKRGATTTILMSDIDGKLDQSFLDKTEAFSWTGAHTFGTATTTFNFNIVASNASSTMGTTTFTQAPYSQVDAVASNQLIRKGQLDVSGIFGDGSDGAKIIDEESTTTRDMYYTNLTISATSTPTLHTGGYRIFVSGTLTNNATITNAGYTTATTTAGGAGGTVGSLGGGGRGAQQVASSMLGGAGGGGGGVMMIAARTLSNSAGTITVAGGRGMDAPACTTEVNSGGTNGNSTSTALGGNGGNGHAGGSSAGTGGTATAPLDKYGGFHHVPAAINLFINEPASIFSMNQVSGGAGGGGGGYGCNAQNSVGGGGGGGGGVLVLIYNSITSGTESVAGGVGGAGSGSGGTGSTGSAGTKITITLP